MTLSTGDLARIQKIIRDKTGQNPQRIRFEAGHIRFETLVGEDLTESACQALLAAGLQSKAGDGEPEYVKSFTEGALKVSVRWPFDPELPTWNE